MSNKMKTTVTTITPPSLYLPSIGPSILFLGYNLEESQECRELCEELFPDTEVAFFVTENGYSPDLNPWLRAVSGMVNVLVVNVDNITTEELAIALFTALEGQIDEVFWVSANDEATSLIEILNSFQFRIIRSFDEINRK